MRRRFGRAFSHLGRSLRFVTARPLLLAAIVGAAATGVAWGGMQTLHWMETEDFCVRCHTMVPQAEAHKFSSHATVECAECHVGEGILGLVRSKLGGMRQMFKLVTGTYLQPIPPGAHGMPPADETCTRCHDPARERPNYLVTRLHFDDDELNSPTSVGLVLRLSANGTFADTKGIHWHVQSLVEYIGHAENPAENGHAGSIPGRIDWIGVERPGGTRVEYLAQDMVEISGLVGLQIEELKRTTPSSVMTCYDCHNRVGHAFLNPSRAVDDALATGRMDVGLPFIKARAVELLSRRYPTREAAARAVRELSRAYHWEYPNRVLEDPGGFIRTFKTLWDLYGQASNPEMDVLSADYPSYLGHLDSTGCFRCHDGGHFKVVDGRLTDEAIPSRCDTCHTFPSGGSGVASIMVGRPPDTHKEKLWLFDHGRIAPSAEPGGTSCGACHSQSYCVNCHESGASLISHDDMLFRHAAVIRAVGTEACSSCHQRPFCARCHTEDELKGLK